MMNSIFLILFFIFYSFSYIDLLVVGYSLLKCLQRIKATFYYSCGWMKRPWFRFIQSLILMFFIFCVLWYRLVFYFMLYNIIFFFFYMILDFFCVSITKKQHRRFSYICFTISRNVSDWAECKTCYAATVETKTFYRRLHDCAQIFSCFEKLINVIIVTPLVFYFIVKNKILFFWNIPKDVNQQNISLFLQQILHLFIIIKYWNFSFSFFSLLLVIKVIIYLLLSQRPLFEFTDSSYRLKMNVCDKLL